MSTDRGEGKAQLLYVTRPDDEQLKKIQEFVRRNTGEDTELELIEDKELESGFILRFGGREYDWSRKGRVAQFADSVTAVNKAGKAPALATDFLVKLNDDIKDFHLKAAGSEIGRVKSVGDNIAVVTGASHAFYGEIVCFESGVKGMVQDIRPGELGVILFGSDRNVMQGDKVVRTKQIAGIPVGQGFLGRVVNALGEPIDGKGPVTDVSGYRPIEFPAPGIVEREQVSVPMETGILAIDSMFPIGRGQRELIVGDRQTGKTTIATDTILNQKGKDVICIYVAIGQKESSVAQIVENFRKKGALDYTIVVAATAAETASRQYIAPYAGTALAEYFMYSGHDVLIVYDDLSKHAVAYRAISLLLGRSPGREAYPGDVFYLHSRLLERASRLTKEAGGGSITALPIIETQAGDVSAYIPTNVISITDGQIYLEEDLFNAGQRPAVNVGLSVSRVGGAAQSPAMKKAAGSIRIDLAQYREMEVFTQFSSDLDDATKKQLAYGRSLMELLKQREGSPLTMAQQVVTLVAATGHIFDSYPPASVKKEQEKLLTYFAQNCESTLERIATAKTLDDSLRDAILNACRKFAQAETEGENGK
ncbi:MAG: F0F1 ATP synthase subunit alpha [Lachnospiraceae bacterium]